MNIFSVNFWTSTLVSTFATLTCIYIIKKFSAKTQLPVVSEIAETV